MASRAIRAARPRQAAQIVGTAARLAASVAAAVLATACRSPGGPLAMQTLIGEFGGDGSALHATSAGASLDFACSRVTFATALQTNADGEFTLGGLRQRVGGAPPPHDIPPIPVQVDGRALASSGGTIRLIVRTPDPAFSNESRSQFDTLVLVRDRPSFVIACP